jgi:hypothetical protein
MTEACERNLTSAPQLGQETICTRLADQFFQQFGLGAVVVGGRDQALVEQALEFFQTASMVLRPAAAGAARPAAQRAPMPGPSPGRRRRPRARADAGHAAFVLRRQRNRAGHLVLV